MLSVSAVTSITDFVLAAEAMLLAMRLSMHAKQRYSAIWYWSAMLFFLGMGALAGGIDHGYFENSGRTHIVIQRVNWLILAAMTFCLWMATAVQFFPPALKRAAPAIGILQFAIDSAFILRVDSFLTVLLNYAPVVLLLLLLNIFGLRNGNGSPYTIAGILVSFAASGIQAAGYDALSPVDHNGLYHLISMVAVVLLYFGGKRLRRSLE